MVPSNGSFKVLLIILVGTFLMHGFSLRAAAQTTVTADFASRTYTGRPIPAEMFGINPTSLTDATARADLAQAGFSHLRIIVGLQKVYATRTPNWNDLDWNLKQMETQGFHPTIVIGFTPPWLQPTPNPCTGVTSLSQAPPTSISTWATLAAAAVAHIDKVFPGLVHDYEIWNEPELQTYLCVLDNTDATRFKTYIAMYAAAGSAMRAQAQRDGVSIRIGGPSISRSRGPIAAEWIGGLTTNSQTAPYVDFISFHLYPTGATDIVNGMTWATLYGITQSPTKGLAYIYLNIFNIVKAGKQPNAANTPIYITEYNDGWAFLQDCCRNSPTFGPLWNSTAIVDFMNTAYAGARIPRLYYYAGSTYPNFCMFGTWNTTMNCDGTSLQPYPQYYAYKLFASNSYLNLSRGGYMAYSVSPGNTGTGLLSTAFYSSTMDAIVIVNPISTGYSSVSVIAKNAGYSSVIGTMYLLNRSNPHITTKNISITKITGGFQTTVAVPAYSVVAISLHP